MTFWGKKYLISFSLFFTIIHITECLNCLFVKKGFIVDRRYNLRIALAKTFEIFLRYY